MAEIRLNLIIPSAEVNKFDSFLIKYGNRITEIYTIVRIFINLLWVKYGFMHPVFNPYEKKNSHV